MTEGPATPGPAPAPSVLLLGAGWFPDQPGGLNRYVRELSAGLEEAGVSSRAIVLGPAGDPPPRVRVVGRTDDPLSRRLLRFARAARELRQPSDVVDAHFALYAALPLLGALRDAPLVVHFHGPWADEGGAAGNGHLQVAVKRAIERFVYRRADQVIVLSKAFKRVAVERYGVRPWDVSIVPPGVDTQRFAPADRARARAALGLPPGAWIVVCPRRLVPRMGVDVLLRAWGQLSEGLRERRLLIVGDGPARPGLEAVASHCAIGDVRFLGEVADETLVAAYRSADLCVIPSLALEGFGLVVLESLACGTPVLATDAGGLPEALARFGSGLVVPAGDPDALAERLTVAYEQPAWLPTRRRCREHAARYTWERAVSAHRSVYDRPRDRSRPRRLRVVFLDHCARLSGGELALLRLLPSLKDVDPHVILAEEGPFAGRLAEAGVSVEVLPMAEIARGLPKSRVRLGDLPVRSALASGAYVVVLARRLRRLAPDLVHTNSLKAALYGGLAARLARVPVVWHVRDRVAPEYLPEEAVDLVQRASALLPNAVIANSRSTLELLSERGPRLPAHSSVVLSTVIYDTVELQRSRCSANDEMRSVGMVGRIAPWKGQHVFLEAFARAFPEGPERAVIIGAPLFGERTYERTLHELAATLGLDGRVEFTGFRDDVRAELARLDALVHASVIPEPFGQVVAEGMVAGLPVVAADAGGPREIIQHEVNGLLYRPGDADALALELQRLSADRALRERIGRAAFRSGEIFASGAIGREVMWTYSQVLGMEEPEWLR